MRRFHDILWADHGNFGTVIRVRASGAFSVCGSLAKITSRTAVIMKRILLIVSLILNVALALIAVRWTSRPVTRRVSVEASKPADSVLVANEQLTAIHDETERSLSEALGKTAF